MPDTTIQPAAPPVRPTEDEVIHEAAFAIQRAIGRGLSGRERDAIRDIVRGTIREIVENQVLRGDWHLEKCAALLPAWFVPRMMTDCWGFGFVLTTGTRVHFECIQDVRQAADGTIWIDVRLHTRQPSHEPRAGFFVAVADDRTTASINAAHIVMAFETETS